MTGAVRPSSPSVVICVGVRVACLFLYIVVLDCAAKSPMGIGAQCELTRRAKFVVNWRLWGS